MQRIITRIASAIALSLSVASCSEQITSGHGRIANVAIVPQMSRADQEIFRSLSTFALNVDNVHVMLFRSATETTLADTVVQFSVTASQIAIQVAVHLDSAQENLSASIELRGGPTVLFAGSEIVTARVGQSSGTGKPVSLTYVGPGSTATLLRITPRSAATFVGGQTRLVATATDVQGLPLPTYPFSWSSSNTAIARIDTTGLITGVSAGTASIIARGITGIADTVPVTVTAAAASLAPLSGDGQTGTVGQTAALPFVVQARTATGGGVPGLSIAFRVTSGSATLQSTSVVTDDKGNAGNALTLSSVAGAITIEASAGTLPALTIRATAAPGAASQLLATLPNPSAYFGQLSDRGPRVQVADQYGNAVALSNLSVSFTVPSVTDSAFFAPSQTRSATASTDATGAAGGPQFYLYSTHNITILATASIGTTRPQVQIPVSYLGVVIPNRIPIGAPALPSSQQLLRGARDRAVTP